MNDQTRPSPRDAASAAEKYRDNGFVNVGPFLSQAQIDEICDALRQFEDERNEYGILRHNVWQEVRCIEDLIRAGDLAAVARDLMAASDPTVNSDSDGGTEVLLFQDNLVWKPPCSTGEEAGHGEEAGKTPSVAAKIEWHQDYSYWPLDTPRGVTQWLALDPTDEENGCLHYVPGTHLLGERQPADFIRGATQAPRSDLPPLDWEARVGQAVPVRVKAGELIAHHPFAWHMSPTNTSGRHRRALSLTWIAADVRWAPEHAPHPYEYQLSPRAGEAVRGDGFPRFLPK